MHALHTLTIHLARNGQQSTYNIHVLSPITHSSIYAPSNKGKRSAKLESNCSPNDEKRNAAPPTQHAPPALPPRPAPPHQTSFFQHQARQEHRSPAAAALLSSTTIYIYIYICCSQTFAAGGKKRKRERVAKIADTHPSLFMCVLRMICRSHTAVARLDTFIRVPQTSQRMHACTACVKYPYQTKPWNRYSRHKNNVRVPVGVRWVLVSDDQETVFCSSCGEGGGAQRSSARVFQQKGLPARST